MNIFDGKKYKLFFTGLCKNNMEVEKERSVLDK
jgi:hypothetical protein